MSFATILAVLVVSIVLMPVASNSYNGVVDTNAKTYSVMTSVNNESLLVEGPDGVTGLRGADGTRGANGADGVNGLRGADGADGADGKALLEEITIP
ncbi:MAG: hypothetical protein ACRD5J_19800 [Nitrososphaeraceae archaeon]